MNIGIVLVFIILAILYEWQNATVYEYFTTTKIVSSLDQRSYKVVGGFTDLNTASDTMSKLNNFIIEFLRFLKNKFIINQYGSQLEQEFVKRMLINYNPDVIFENDPKPGGDTSFVVNKGKQFGICLRNKKTKNIHNANLLKFVMIHEMSHLGCIKYGHGYQFWSWMKFMLIQAKESGIYTPVNYAKNPTTYCGTNVSFSPFFSDKYDWHDARAD
jgi:hypothetical protein